jgi:hypothetical protein
MMAALILLYTWSGEKNTNVLHIAEQPQQTHLGGKLEILLMLGGEPLYKI